MDRILVLNQRTRLVARRVMQYLNATDPYAKTIIFCEDIDHAERMRAAIVNESGTLAIEHPKYVMRSSGDRTEGKAEMDNCIDPESRFPVIATTSDLMTTGVDARTCKLIVLDKTINSMTTFKQIIGRGTRILEEYNKFFFTIMDFRKLRRYSMTRTSTVSQSSFMSQEMTMTRYRPIPTGIRTARMMMTGNQAVASRGSMSAAFRCDSSPSE